MPKQDRLPRIGELELAVLEHLWTEGDADVLEVHAIVGKGRGITSNTIGSTLERLHRKGLAEREKVSHAYRYRASLSRDDFAARRMLDAAGGLKTLTEAGLLSAFVDLVAEQDAESLDRLELLIEEKRKKRSDS